MEYKWYDISWYDKDIIKKRREGRRISTILTFLVEKLPIIDELLLLKQLTRVLNQHDLSFAKLEVVKAMNKYKRRTNEAYLDFLSNKDK